MARSGYPPGYIQVRHSPGVALTVLGGDFGGSSPGVAGEEGGGGGGGGPGGDAGGVDMEEGEVVAGTPRPRPTPTVTASVGCGASAGPGSWHPHGLPGPALLPAPEDRLVSFGFVEFVGSV